MKAGKRASRGSSGSKGKSQGNGAGSGAGNGSGRGAGGDFAGVDVRKLKGKGLDVLNLRATGLFVGQLRGCNKSTRAAVVAVKGAGTAIPGTPSCIIPPVAPLLDKEKSKNKTDKHMRVRRL